MSTSSETIVSTGSATRHPVGKGAAGWARWLFPSLADFQFLSVFVWVFAVGSGGWARLLFDCDAGWHIRTGQWILQHGRVPSTDLFSFTKPGQEWFAWEWLAEVIYGGLFTLGGLKAVVLLAGILFAAYGAIVFQHAVWRGANVFIALPVGLLAVGAAMVHVLARPHLWTMLFFALAWFLVERDRRTPAASIWWLVPLAVVWTNLHGGFLALVATLGLVTAGTAVEAWRGSSTWAAARRYAGLTAATAGASLLNPYGWHLHTHLAAYLQSDWILNVVSEFQSPSFRSEQISRYELLLLAGLAACGWLLLRGRFVEPLVLAFWAHQSLISARHIPLLSVVAAPVVAEALAQLWAHWTRDTKGNSVPGIMAALAAELQPSLKRWSVWAVVPLVAIALLNAPFHWPANFPKERFPVDMVEKQAGVIHGARVFTQDQWADYLIFRFYPEQRVFFDGRSDFYGPALGGEYQHILKGEYDWSQLLDKHGIEVVLVPPNVSLASLLKLKSGWELLADDGKALLFRRVGPVPAVPKTRDAA